MRDHAEKGAPGHDSATRPLLCISREIQLALETVVIVVAVTPCWCGGEETWG